MAVDLFANAANTTLTAALTAGATSLTVTSSTPFPAVTTAAGTQFRVIIDSELFIVTNVTGLTWTVTPGAEGTTQAAHASGATVTAIFTAAAAAGLTIAAPPFPYHPEQPFTTKYIAAHIPGQGSGNGLGSSASGGLMVAPLRVSATCTVNTIGAGMHSNGSVGSVIRLGLYADDGAVWPGALILDAGTIDGTVGSNGSIAISQVLKVGVLYWAALSPQGAPTTNPNIKASGTNNGLTGFHPAAGPSLNEGALQNAQDFWFQGTGVTGALPATFPSRALVTSAGNAPVITFRVA